MGTWLNGKAPGCNPVVSFESRGSSPLRSTYIDMLEQVYREGLNPSAFGCVSSILTVDTMAKISRDGIDFKWKGDEVWYVWPWLRRNKRTKFISLSFQAGYPSLRALDKEWEGYFEHEMKDKNDINI